MGATERTRHVRGTHDVFLCMPHPSDIIPVTSQCHHFLVNVFFSFPFFVWEWAVACRSYFLYASVIIYMTKYKCLPLGKFSKFIYLEFEFEFLKF